MTESFYPSFDEFDCESIDITDVDLSKCLNTVVINERNHTFFFLGEFDEDGGRRGYGVYPVLRHPRTSEEWKRLVQVVRGKLCRSFGIVAMRERPTKAKILNDYVVCLPDGGARRYFSVERRSDGKIHDRLTRAVFGLSMQEYDELMQCFCHCFQHRSSLSSPRLTSSRTRDNRCSLTRRWIPANFPYIALAESNYYGGHVSLAGFLELFTFLCPHQENDRSYQMMVQSGLDPQILQIAIQNLFGGGGAGEIYDHGSE